MSRRIAAAVAAAVADAASFVHEYPGAVDRTDQRRDEWFSRCWEHHCSVFGPLYLADEDLAAETAYEDTVAELLCGRAA